MFFVSGANQNPSHFIEKYRKKPFGRFAKNSRQPDNIRVYQPLMS